jgi:hypothetical protein
MAATANIREHMEVYGSDHVLVGVVDHMEGDDMIKLTKSDSADGQHHFIDAELVDHVDSHVHLSKPADEIMAEWEDDESLELDEDDASTEIETNEEKQEEDWIERRR